MSSLIDEFMSISGVSSKEEASNWLEMGGLNLETAINLFFSNSSTSLPSITETPITNVEEFVRPPDKVRKQKLIDDIGSTTHVSSLRGVYKAEDIEEEEEQKSSYARPAKNLHDLFKPPTDLISKNSNLEDLFIEASNKCKWLLINIQDYKNFSSNVLNRDFWNVEHVKALVKENFIFSQIPYESTQGVHYLKMFHPSLSSEKQKQDFLPLVTIHEPRTKSEVFSISGTDLDNEKLFWKLQDFLGEYPIPDSNSIKEIKKLKNKIIDISLTPSSSSSKRKAIEIVDITEQSQKKIKINDNIDEEDEVQIVTPLNNLEKLNSKTLLALIKDEPSVDGEMKINLKLRWSWGGNSLLKTSQTTSVSHLLYFIASQVPFDRKEEILTIAFGIPTRVITLQDLDKKLEDVEIKENILITVRLD